MRRYQRFATSCYSQPRAKLTCAPPCPSRGRWPSPRSGPRARLTCAPAARRLALASSRTHILPEPTSSPAYSSLRTMPRPSCLYTDACHARFQPPFIVGILAVATVEKLPNWPQLLALTVFLSSAAEPLHPLLSHASRSDAPPRQQVSRLSSVTDASRRSAVTWHLKSGLLQSYTPEHVGGVAERMPAVIALTHASSCRTAQPESSPSSPTQFSPDPSQGLATFPVVDFRCIPERRDTDPVSNYPIIPDPVFQYAIRYPVSRHPVYPVSRIPLSRIPLSRISRIPFSRNPVSIIP